ncbi:MAG: amidohydrolase [bacterium]
MRELVELRRRLHTQPELSHHETATAEIIHSFLLQNSPDELLTELGGHGLAAVYRGELEGPQVLVRCELDALPIPETIALDYSSQSEQVAHKCGHDGHMTILAGLAQQFGARRPARGSVVLLFQPAEETGEGAALVINDPKFQSLKPDFAIALHNLPGFPLGEVVLREGSFASASTGLIIRLQGKTSHAAEPQQGRSPALAVAQLIEGLSSLPQFRTALHEAAQVTVIHARLGEVAFGTSPGAAEVMATIRSRTPEVMDKLTAEAAELARNIGAAYGLTVETETTQTFPATINDPQVVEVIAEAAADLKMNVYLALVPFGWSEDFGHFTDRFRGALFGLGAGEHHPALHNPTYDFPEELIEPGMKLFTRIIENLLN